MLTVDVDADGIDRVDLELDGRPLSSTDIGQNPLSTTIDGATAGQLLRVDGYSDGELVASRRVRVRPERGRPAARVPGHCHTHAKSPSALRSAATQRSLRLGPR
jgi:hypothetical protein